MEYDGQVWESELLGLEIAPVLIAIREHQSWSMNWRHDVPEHPNVLASYEDVAGWAEVNCPNHEQFFLRELPSLTLFSSAGVTSVVDLSIEGALCRSNTRVIASLLGIGAPLSRLFTALQSEPHLMLYRQYWDARILVPERRREVNHLGYWHDDLGVMLSPEYTEYDVAALKRIRASFRRRNSDAAREGALQQFEALWASHQPEVRVDAPATSSRQWWRPSR